MYSKKIFLGLFFLAGLLLGETQGWSCPMCKAGFVSAINPGALARLGEGYFWSILLMIAIPFTLVGSITLAIIQANRKRKR